MSADPVDWTPHVLDGDVVKFAQLGNTMYARGSFSAVRNAGSTSPIPRSNLFAFDATAGGVLPLDLAVNGKVWGIVPVGDFLYLAGEFTAINGVATPYAAKWDLADNRLDPTFRPVAISGRATDMELVNGRLVISGSFPKKLIALDPTTGTDTGFIDIAVSGTVSPVAGPRACSASPPIRRGRAWRSWATSPPSPAPPGARWPS